VNSVQARSRKYERALLAEALLCLVLARLALRIFPFRWTTRLLAFQPGEGGFRETGAQDADSVSRANRVRWALTIASRRVPWHSDCITRALAGACMLRLRCKSSVLAVGVSNSILSGDLQAHAWLLSGGVVVTGGRVHQAFRPIITFAYNPDL
jgi:hypothetical protein